MKWIHNSHSNRKLKVVGKETMKLIHSLTILGIRLIITLPNIVFDIFYCGTSKFKNKYLNLRRL